MAKVSCEAGFTQLTKLNILDERKLTVNGKEADIINPDYFTGCTDAVFIDSNSFSLAGNQTDSFAAGRKIQIDSGENSVNCNIPVEDLTPDDIFTVNKYDYSVITENNYDGLNTIVTIADSILNSDLESVCYSIEFGASSISPEYATNFETVENMINGTDLGGNTVDYSLLVGAIVETKQHNSESEFGGAKYIIKTKAQADSDGNDYTTGGDDFGLAYLDSSGDYVAVLKNQNKINAMAAGVRQGAAPSISNSDAIMAAFGGSGSAKDDISLSFPDGDFYCDKAILIYRSGDILKNVEVVGQSATGTRFFETTPTKGFIFGETNSADGIGGSGTAINTIGVRVRNISHKFSDIGLWFVYCQHVLAENIQGQDLLCVACGNDAWDDCEDVILTNIKRTNDGRDTTPDAWYSIGLYRVTRFVVDGYTSEFLPTQGTAGNHVIMADCDTGTVKSCVIQQATVFSTGINLETGTKNVNVIGNVIRGCGNGVVSFSATNNNNIIIGNYIDSCDYGINCQSPSNYYLSNVIVNSNIKDVYSASNDAVANKFIGNYAAGYEFLPSIEGTQTFMGNFSQKTRIFIPSTSFKQFLPAATQETIDPTSYRLTNTAGTIRATTTLETGGRAGTISNIVFHFDRLVATTNVNCYLTTLTNGGGNTQRGEVLDATGSTGLVDATIGFYSGSSIDVYQDQQAIAIYIPTAASISELIGVSFDFEDKALFNFISN